MRIIRSEKAFTLVEIIVVIAIISLLFITLLPQVSAAVLKAQESGVKTDFKDFQHSSEALMRATLGKNITAGQLNRYLDKSHEITDVGGGILQAKSEDSWGNPYGVEVQNGKILFYSIGKEEIAQVKQYQLVTYYHAGRTFTCSVGFQTNNLPMPLEGKTCGEDLGETALPEEPAEEPQIVTSGLIGYWHYRQGMTGGAWRNLAPNTAGQYDGIVNGATLQVNGVSFDGGDWVTVAGFPSSHTKFSTEVVVSLNTTNAQSIIGFGSVYRVWYSATSNRGFTIDYDHEVSSTAASVYSMQVASPAQFYTITTTWGETSSKESKIYINGQLVNHQYPGKTGWFGKAGAFYIGSVYNGGNMNGKIKSVKFYNRPLSAEEVQQNNQVGADNVGL